jgi:hypothetical protein
LLSLGEEKPMEIIESFALIGVITALFVWYGIAAGRRESGKAKFSGNAVASRPGLENAPQGFKTFTT